MAHDLTKPYEYPFPMPSEAEIAYGEGAIPGKRAGSPTAYAEGGSTRWTPEAIAEVHALAQLGRYQVRGFNTFNKRLPTFDDLTFVPASMTRLPLEGYRESCDTTTVLGAGRGLVERPLELKIPIYIASMSFGALSASAKTALGHGASKVGTMTCTGEGGMLEEERAASQRLLYQISPARYGLDLDHLRRADALEVIMGQGAKPGTGGLLLGMKVSPRVSKMRTLPEGVDQRSTARHPDFLGADDLSVKIEELRIATNYQVPIFVKMGATRPRFDVAIAAKAGADVVVVDGAEGGTGASPELLLNHTGIPNSLGHPRRARGLGRSRPVGQGQPRHCRRHPHRRRCRQVLGARRRCGDDRHGGHDGAGLQRAALRGGLRQARHRPRRLPPLPHRPVSGWRGNPGSRA